MLSARQRIENMLDIAQKLVACVDRNNLTESNITSDVDVQWMVSTPIMYLSEQAAKMVSEHKDVVERLDGIDWYALRGLRNRIVHEYDGLNFSLLAQFVLVDVRALIPDLRKALNDILAEN